MKLPNPIQSLFRPKQVTEVFLSLILLPDGVIAAGWHMDASNNPIAIGFSRETLENDNWEDRTKAADRTIAALEEKLDENAQIRKVVLGLPIEYLTNDGDINPDVRTQMKQLTQVLDLTPMGFVSVPAAIVYSLKKTEGVPPSVILLGFSDHRVVISVYKVGLLIGQETIDRGDNLPTSIEHVLKQFKELEVLPSRIILYGASDDLIEENKADLMRHPWPTKANFLHFPKFDHIPISSIVESVSLAGASEMTTALREEPVETKPEPRESQQNIEIVEPETLGFANEDVLERTQPEEKPKQKFSLPKLPSLPSFPIQGNGMYIGLTGILLLIILGLFVWILPKATVTVLVLPQTLETTLPMTVDPKSTVADSQTSIIPGHTREDSLSGEKTIPVSGTKKIGDPAKGGITIYNKSLNSRTFKKGSILAASGIQFTLDADVEVVEAAESIGSITFGKATGSVTAKEIGPEGNLPAGTDFTFSEIGTSIAIARNDEKFAGGTSREVTVVTRSDYDALVTQLTEELLQQTKEKLATSISGGEKLIDATLKTSVTEKTFTQELDQEAKELAGKITITVSGISYSETDVVALFTDRVSSQLMPGYAFDNNSFS